jgi:hypothetical protein
VAGSVPLDVAPFGVTLAGYEPPGHLLDALVHDHAIMHGHSIQKVSWGEVVAASFIARVPILPIFLVPQRRVIGGLRIGSLAG